MFEMTKKRPEDKRKRHLNDDPGNIEGFIGPWGKYVDEKTVMKPNEVGIAYFLYDEFRRGEMVRI